MTIDGKIWDEKLQYKINREATKISALSSAKVDKYEFLTGEEILPSNQSRIIEWAKFTYLSFGKTFEKQTKTVEDQGIKQVEPLKALEPEENQELESTEGFFWKKMKNNEVENDIDEIGKWKEKIKRKDLKYETKKYVYDFQKFEAIRYFGNNICTGNININEAEIDQSNLLEIMVEFNDKSKQMKGKNKNRDTYESVNVLYENWELTLNAFKGWIFPIKSTQGKGLKNLKTTLVLPMALAQVKADNASEKLLNEIRKIVYFLYSEKEITKKYTTISGIQ